MYYYLTTTKKNKQTQTITNKQTKKQTTKKLNKNKNKNKSKQKKKQKKPKTKQKAKTRKTTAQQHKDKTKQNKNKAQIIQIINSTQTFLNTNTTESKIELFSTKGFWQKRYHKWFYNARMFLIFITVSTNS